MADGDFKQEDFDRILKLLHNRLTFGLAPVEHPTAFLLGGQAGAGKSGLQQVLSNKCNNNVVIVNIDDFREYHPDFKNLDKKYGKDSVDYTGRFAGQMTGALCKLLRDEKYNVIVEGTLRTVDVPRQSCEDFKKAGYKVVLGIIAVKPEISYMSTIYRYEAAIAEGKVPRATDKDYHDSVVRAIPENLRALYDEKQFDNILIYNRSGDCLYDMSAENAQVPDKIIQEVFYGDWTSEELDQFVFGANEVIRLMKQRDAPELSSFQSSVYNEEIVIGFTISGERDPSILTTAKPDLKFSDQEEEAAYQKIKMRILRGKSSVEKPVSIILGGQPGSGKSNLYKLAKARFNQNIVELDCDKFRKYHPMSELFAAEPETYGLRTNDFVFSAVDRLVEELSTHKFNMIAESTMKNSKVAFKNHDTVAPKGYTVESYIMATPKEISWQGVLARYEEMIRKGEQPRIVPKSVHDEAVEGIAIAADEIYRSGKLTNMQVFNRNGTVLYEMKATPKVSPKAILRSIINGDNISQTESEDEQMKKDDFQILVQQAREKNILDYFQESGYSIEKKSSNYYVTEIAGLCLKPESNQWYYHYENIGRTNNSIDCLTKVLNMDFNQAVYELTGKDLSHFKAEELPKKQQPQYTAPPTKIALPEKKELVMPEQSDNMRRLFAYFCKSRHIPAKIVEELVHAKLLYQTENEATAVIKGVEKTFKNANAVFIHKDDKGEIIGGEVQGLNTFKRFKGVAPGTGESVFKFVPNPSADGKIKRAYLFESAIDLMSFYSFCKKEKIEGAMLISMAGLKPTVPKQLRDQGIEIVSCVDNDEAGRKFEAENGFKRPDGVKSLLDNNGFKDWNEMLSFRAEHPNAKLDENLRKNNDNSNDMSSSIGGR